MILETYEPFKIGKITRNFTHDYVADESLEDPLESLSYSEGETLQVLGKVKSDLYNSGFGYVVYDDQLEDSFVLDSSLLEITE